MTKLTDTFCIIKICYFITWSFSYPLSISFVYLQTKLCGHAAMLQSKTTRVIAVSCLQMYSWKCCKSGYAVLLSTHCLVSTWNIGVKMYVHCLCLCLLVSCAEAHNLSKFTESSLCSCVFALDLFCHFIFAKIMFQFHCRKDNISDSINSYNRFIVCAVL